jgi:hypothetical protein
MGPAGHDRAAMLVRLSGQRTENVEKFGLDQVQPVTHLQNRGGVHDVLRGGAPMRPRTGVTGGFRQAGNQPDHRIADIAGAGGEVLGPQILEFRRRDDGGRRIGGDDAQAALHAGERGLDIQHALEIGGFVEHRAHGIAAVKRAEDRAVGGIDGHGGHSG